MPTIVRHMGFVSVVIAWERDLSGVQDGQKGRAVAHKDLTAFRSSPCSEESQPYVRGTVP